MKGQNRSAKVTPAHIETLITGEHHFTTLLVALPAGIHRSTARLSLMMHRVPPALNLSDSFCVLVLKTGFAVLLGISLQRQSS